MIDKKIMMLKQIFITSIVLGNSFCLFAQAESVVSTDKGTVTDKNIVVPEEMERNFDQLLVDWKKNMQPSRDCDNMSSAIPLTYDDSIYISRLYSLPTEMELVYNPVVRSYIDLYTGRRKSGVEIFLGKSNYYFPIFEKELDKHGLPLELKYLPVIESALNPTIVSRAGATGLWQFMLGTGKMYDLEINSLVDERRDPLKSTEAAVRYLKDLYDIYGDWTLVIAAYNCGPGNVNKAIKRSGGARDYWEIYNYLPKETRGYVPAFIATAYIMNYYKDHNICAYEYKYTVSTDTIHVDKQLHLQQVADVLNVSIDQLRDLNPQYKKDIVPGEFKAYVLKLPSMKASDFVVYEDSVYSYKIDQFLAHRKVVEPKGTSYASNNTRTYYKVRRGDNLGSIAKRHRISVTQLRKWNNLKSNSIRAGQLLAVGNKPSPSNKNDKPDAILIAEGKSTEVPNNSIKSDTPLQNRGADPDQASVTETSGLLAQYYTKVHESNTPSNEEAVVVLTEDSINSDDSIAGTEEAFYAEARPDDFQTTQTIYHKVRIGETLAQIATRYNVTRKDIKSWNKISSNVAKVGQRLVIHLPPQKEVAKAEVPLIDDEVEIDDVVTEIKSDNDKILKKQTASTKPILPTASSEATKSEINVPTKDKKITAPAKPKPIVYSVRKGDTLGAIAAKYGRNVTPQKIMKINKLSTDRLSVGQKLTIPRG